MKGGRTTSVWGRVRPGRVRLVGVRSRCGTGDEWKGVARPVEGVEYAQGEERKGTAADSECCMETGRMTERTNSIE